MSTCRPLVPKKPFTFFTQGLNIFLNTVLATKPELLYKIGFSSFLLNFLDTYYVFRKKSVKDGFPWFWFLGVVLKQIGQISCNCVVSDLTYHLSKNSTSVFEAKI